jgi:hypothetical protein
VVPECVSAVARTLHVIVDSGQSKISVRRQGRRPVRNEHYTKRDSLFEYQPSCSTTRTPYSHHPNTRNPAMSIADGPSSSRVPSFEPTGLSNLLQVSRLILVQARNLLVDTLTADEHLTFESRLMPGSTIGIDYCFGLALNRVLILTRALQLGKHLRHARDHFELLLQSISSHPPLIFSYDKRMRNTPMETLVSSAYDALSSTISQLEHLSSVCEADSEHGKGFITVNDRRIDLDEPMTLNAVTPDMQTLQTSFGRELWFAGLHAVHHWSMIRVIAGELVSAFHSGSKSVNKV